MDKIRDKIQAWPRWIRYGLLSTIAALIIFMVGILAESLNLSFFEFASGSRINTGEIVLLGILVITWPFAKVFPSLLPKGLPWSELPYALIGWFLFGALLGKFTKSIRAAVGIWLFFLCIIMTLSCLVFAMLDSLIYNINY